MNITCPKCSQESVSPPAVAGLVKCCHCAEWFAPPMPAQDKSWRVDSVARTEPGSPASAPAPVAASAPAIAHQVLKIPCPHCGDRITFEAGRLGQIADCPGCGMSVGLKVPGLEPSVPTPVPAPAPAPVIVSAPAAPEDLSGAVVTGYLMAFLMPIIGFLLGVYLLCKNNGSGAVIIVLSILATFVWVTIFNL